jgi:tryptophan 2,3-dioxygenase
MKKAALKKTFKKQATREAAADLILKGTGYPTKVQGAIKTLAAHLNSTESKAAIPDPGKERQSKIADVYESVTNYLQFLREQIMLLDAAHQSPYEMPDMAWTFVELTKKIDKLEDLKEQWFNLDNPKKEKTQTEMEKAA